MEKGIFITFEGGEGCGKSSAIKGISRKMNEAGIDYICTREPGGTSISEKIRQIILDPTTPEMSPRTEALLYAASRAQHTEEKIKPALEKGQIVLCDRYLDSSLAYQGYARNLGIKNILTINDFGIDYCRPDLVFFLNIKPSLAFGRIKNRNFDRLEKEELQFHEDVYKYFLQASKTYPYYRDIDATQPIEMVIEEIWQQIITYKK